MNSNINYDAKRLRIDIVRGFLTYIPEIQAILFKFNFSAFSFELCLHTFSLSLWKSLLQSLRSVVNQILSVLQTKTGKFLNEFDYFKLVGTS